MTVAWISDFPLEWLPDLPEPLRSLPKRHPLTWMRVLLDEFRKNPNLRVHVIVLRHRIPKAFIFEREGVTFHVLRAKPLMRLGSFFWLDTFVIRKALKQIKPDLVHAWGSEKGAGLIAARLPYPSLMTVQGLFGWYQQLLPLHGYEKVMSKFEAASLRRTPLVTTESNFAVNYLHEHYPRVNVVQAEHAPNPIFRQVVRKPDTKPVHFVFIGTLDYRKGGDLLFQALAALVPELDFKLTVITNFSVEQVEQLRKQHPGEVWSRVDVKRNLGAGDIAQNLSTATMLLLPTRADTSPNAVKEAVVAGVPVVATDVGGIPDYVFPGKNGILCRPGNLDSFIKAIREAAGHPLLGRGLVDEETLRSTRDYLSPSRMADNFLRAYDQARKVRQ